jgi:hypothetical protein
VKTLTINKSELKELLQTTIREEFKRNVEEQDLTNLVSNMKKNNLLMNEDEFLKSLE